MTLHLLRVAFQMSSPGFLSTLTPYGRKRECETQIYEDFRKNFRKLRIIWVYLNFSFVED